MLACVRVCMSHRERLHASGTRGRAVRAVCHTLHHLVKFICLSHVASHRPVVCVGGGRGGGEEGGVTSFPRHTQPNNTT